MKILKIRVQYGIVVFCIYFMDTQGILNLCLELAIEMRWNEIRDVKNNQNWIMTALIKNYVMNLFLAVIAVDFTEMLVILASTMAFSDNLL